MAVPPKPHIIDASVLIDFEHGGVIRELFLLHHRWATPDLVIVEVGEFGLVLAAQNLDIISFEPEEMLEIINLRKAYRGLSIPDLSCLMLAKSQNGILIAGDRALRVAAEKEGIRVRGTLWILDEMVHYKILTGEQAATVLARMIKNQGRFPPEEITKRINRWVEKL